jgi:hypothetical protein
MGNIDQIVSVQITAQSNAPSRESFGVPAILAYHTHNTDLIRTYNDLAGMVSDGFSSNEPAYLMATAIVSQNPRPPAFKVIRGTTSTAQTFTVTVTDNNVDDKVGLSILDSDGTIHDLYHTVAFGESTDQVATALALVIAAVSGVTSSTATGSVILTTLTTSGDTWYPSLEPNDSSTFRGGFQGVTWADTSTDVNADDDLTAVVLVDKDFYGVSSQYIGADNIQTISAWCEANKRIHSYVTADGANLVASSGIMSTLKGLSYKYSFGVFTQTPWDFVALGLEANRFTADPGTDTWDLKQVTGAIPDDNLTPTQLQNITTNNGNYFTTTGGLEIMTDGRSAQGQFMDLTRGIDALANDMQVEVFGLLASAPKVPFTSKGISSVAGAVAASLARFTASDAQPNALLSNDAGFQPQVLPPKIGSISQADKKDRILRKMNWTAVAAGAIQTVFIQGVVNF